MKAYTHLSGVYDALMTDIPYKQWLKSLIETLSDNQIIAGGWVLDAGCGTGRIAIGLKKAGFSVIGTDVSEAMLTVAEQNTQKAGVHIQYIVQSLENLRLAHQMDAVTAVCDVVNYVAQNRIRACFESVAGCLKSGGLFIFDISSAHKLKEKIGSQVFFEDRPKMTYIWTNKISRDYIDMEITLFENRDGVYLRKDEYHRQYIHPADILTDRLKKSGFTSIVTYDGYTDKRADENSERIRFVAKKA